MVIIMVNVQLPISLMDRIRNAMSNSKNKASNKQKAVDVREASNVEEVPRRRVRRIPNWEESHTHRLLGIVHELQVRRNTYDFSFTAAEYNWMLAEFRNVVQGTTVTKENISNRLKTLKYTFGVLRELASKSGWGWNYETDELLYPSEEDLREVLELCPDKKKWYNGKKFPLYRQMEEVCNPGRGLPGVERNNCFTTFSATSNHSGSGSSDDPDTARVDGNDDSTTVQQPSRMTPGGVNKGVQKSDGSAPLSGGSSSGTKRKSTDTPDDNRRSSRSRLRPRDQILERIAQVGEDLVNKYNLLSSKEKQKDDQLIECYEKLDKLGIDGPAHAFCVRSFDSKSSRTFFLHSSEDKIWKWLKNNGVPIIGNNVVGNIHENNTQHTYFMPNNMTQSTPNIPPDNGQSFSALLNMNYPFGRFPPGFSYPPNPPQN